MSRNETVFSKLRCPHCGAEGSVTEDRKSFVCNGQRRHCFDFAKSGYLNFAKPEESGKGDGKEAVRARSLFLSGGYYQPLSDRLNELLAENRIGSVLDAGCGEGYYTNRMTGEDRIVLGVDLSRDAVDHAAKAAKAQENRARFAVGSLFTLPVADESFEAVTNIFAPCAEAEFARILKPGGSLFLAGAGERHLFGLKQLIYENPYLNPGREDLPTRFFREVEKIRLHYTVKVEGREQIAALFSMTPYYWRTSQEDKQKLEGVEALETEVDFTVFHYRKEN